MTAKKAAKKKATPRKRAAKKQVVHPLPPPAPVQPETIYMPYVQESKFQHFEAPPIGVVRVNTEPQLTWWQRLMNRINDIIDGRVQGTSDPP